jgi:hemerythrin-like metal-binding protein
MGKKVFKNWGCGGEVYILIKSIYIMPEFKTFLKEVTEFKVGIKEIDNQHKRLLNLITSINLGISKKQNKKKFSEDLDRLIEDLKMHFHTEEGYFRKWGYPYYKEHMIEHEKITLKVLRFSERSARGEDVSSVLLEFLKEWIENHFNVHDKKYAKYFRENKLI